jgi:hypothetical protein
MTTFSIVSNQLFLLFKGRHWVLEAIKIPTTVVVSEEAMNDDWMMFAVRGQSVTLRCAKMSLCHWWGSAFVSIFSCQTHTTTA